jgi:hypothetical protein
MLCMNVLKLMALLNLILEQITVSISSFSQKISPQSMGVSSTKGSQRIVTNVSNNMNSIMTKMHETLAYQDTASLQFPQYVNRAQRHAALACQPKTSSTAWLLLVFLRLQNIVFNLSAQRLQTINTE